MYMVYSFVTITRAPLQKREIKNRFEKTFNLYIPVLVCAFIRFNLSLKLERDDVEGCTVPAASGAAPTTFITGAGSGALCIL
mmetsp:Transcript_10820/g.11900  ORF Transcript_10820/g.11900 Transcript_10820/m.11900 type:complete len:82 (+) Transcript_10820:1-246(+)